MALYLSLITLAICILSAINIVGEFISYSPAIVIAIICGGVAIQFALDGLFAFLVHLMPNKWFEIDKKFYNVSNGERKFYEKIKIRKWKDKVWELGSLGGFSKKSLKSSNDKEYLKRFLIESNKGVVTHIIGCFVGFALIPIYLPFSCIWSISLPIAIINVFLNLPSLFILRYNTPKLLAGYKRLIRKDEKKVTEPHPVENKEENNNKDESNNVEVDTTSENVNTKTENTNVTNSQIENE